MAYWLMKSEPDAWSWEQQVKKGAKGEAWTGVRNHTAKLNLMKMKKGDHAFFYHSNIGKEIVGIVEIIREHFPDQAFPAAAHTHENDGLRHGAGGLACGIGGHE